MTANIINKNILQRLTAQWQLNRQPIDPVVLRLIEAMSYELNKIYDHIDGIESRLLDDVTQTLLPTISQSLAHGLLAATPYRNYADVTEFTSFEAVNQLTFSALHNARLIHANVKIMANEQGIVQEGVRLLPEVRILLLGIETLARPSDWKNVSIFVDVPSKSGLEKSYILKQLSNAHIWLNDSLMQVRKGVHAAHSEPALQAVQAIYSPHFWTIDTIEQQLYPQLKTKNILNQHFETTGLSKAAILHQLALLPDAIADGQFTWLTIVLPQMLHLDVNDIEIKFNVIPVVNRKLQRERFLATQNSFGLQCFPIQPTATFVGIHEVRHEFSGEKLPFRPFGAPLTDTLTYTLRKNMGGKDKYHTWKRLMYLFALLREEYQQQEIVQHVGNLPLEDVHFLLGEQMTVADAPHLPIVYVLIDSADAQADYEIQFWTTDGADANDLQPNTSLTTTTNCFESENIYLIAATKGGTNLPNKTIRLEKLRQSLLNRHGKLVTEQDIISFCESKLSELIERVELRGTIGLHPRFGRGLTRMHEIVLTPKDNTVAWDLICVELTALLEQQSVSTIPFKVILKD
jgi:hypothetical protein